VDRDGAEGKTGFYLNLTFRFISDVGLAKKFGH
jgi:hypothetical protein